VSLADLLWSLHAEAPSVLPRARSGFERASSEFRNETDASDPLSRVGPPLVVQPTQTFEPQAPPDDTFPRLDDALEPARARELVPESPGTHRRDRSAPDHAGPDTRYLLPPLVAQTVFNAQSPEQRRAPQQPRTHRAEPSAESILREMASQQRSEVALAEAPRVPTAQPWIPHSSVKPTERASTIESRDLEPAMRVRTPSLPIPQPLDEPLPRADAGSPESMQALALPRPVVATTPLPSTVASVRATVPSLQQARPQARPRLPLEDDEQGSATRAKVAALPALRQVPPRERGVPDEIARRSADRAPAGSDVDRQPDTSSLELPARNEDREREANPSRRAEDVAPMSPWLVAPVARQVEAAASREASQGRDAESRPAPEPRIVQVHIGRIVVRAPASAPRTEPVATQSTRSTLSAYLQRRGGAEQ
jgi:hypothetical protein